MQLHVRIGIFAKCGDSLQNQQRTQEAFHVLRIQAAFQEAQDKLARETSGGLLFTWGKRTQGAR